MSNKNINPPNWVGIAGPEYTATQLIEREEALGGEIQEVMCRFLEPVIKKMISIIEKHKGLNDEQP